MAMTVIRWIAGSHPGNPRRMDVRVEPFTWARELALPDQVAVTRIFNAVWDEWIPGERPLSVAAYVDLDRFSAPPERIERRLLRNADGVVVAHGQVHWRTEPGASVVRAMVDPSSRGHGLGRVLVGELVGGWADEACRAAGLRPDMVVEQNRTSTADIDAAVLERWRAAGAARHERRASLGGRT